MEVNVTVDPDGSLTVTVSDEPFSPDVLDMACRRAGDETLRLWRELHPATVE
jgi:hypothetical protein